MTDRTANKYYLYYISDDGAGMILTGFKPAHLVTDGIARSTWSTHLDVFAWNMPLLFPTLEQAETHIDEQEYNFNDHAPVHIGRWLTMSNCRRNEHPPVE